MEIRTSLGVVGAPKLAPIVYKEAHHPCMPKPGAVGKIIIYKNRGYSGSHPLNPSHFNLQASPRGLEKLPSHASSATTFYKQV